MNFKNLERSRILITGHTGFKGAWLSRFLNLKNAQISGIALAPEKNSILSKSQGIRFESNLIFDIVELQKVTEAVELLKPEVIIHMAAQPIVMRSYEQPVKTFLTNVMGTANILEASRKSKTLKGVIVVTSDKVYENIETTRGYKEEDPISGKDPYSASKAASEMVVKAWQTISTLESNIPIISVRSGNIIGGGDHSEGRLIPDLIRSFRKQKSALIRSPNSLRPWQHVLDTISGYLRVVDAILNNEKLSSSYNFGPINNLQFSVAEIADIAARSWGAGATWVDDNSKKHLPEAKLLWLDSSKAQLELGWSPILNPKEAVEWTVRWEKMIGNVSVLDAIDIQINEYEALSI